ncbi:hypothetical protein HYH03_008520 [Edaphochlamys debaryana]|uniref:Uncharacterized protein n=1 Tax=Edaphochlamys debaryana TaxID=47281 RepID=A0A836BY29_9CHLO|nr:hypothetical protein HYH03_008520 [Edaphochlamys debaryana]|eukprot:KAG2493391.1 hypothetical protein HYH03_008520 [Edaphochlamys debaryana]
MSGGDDKPQALPGPVEAAAASGAGGGDDEQPPAAAAEAPGAAAEGEAAAPAAADEDKGQGGDDDGGVTEAAAGEQGAAAAAIAAEPEAAEGEEQGQEKAEGKGEGEGQEGGDEGPESESDWELGAEGGGGEGKQGQEGAGEKEGEAAPAPLPPGALEEGHIFFFYRPKVQQLQPSSLDDVARFYIAMQPRHRRPPAGKDEMADTLAPSARADDAGEKIATAEGGNKADEKEEAGGSKETGSEGEGGSGGGGAEAAGGGLPCRLIVVGKKRLPDARRHDRFFGFVSAVAPTVADLTAGMGEEHYATKTRGERTQPAARAAGRGTYSIFSRLHGKTRTHTELAYLLQLPTEPGEAQRELGIAPSARYVICIKNPNNKRPGAPSAGPEPAYTPAQRSAFAGGTAWVGAEEVSLLDVQGTELLLIGAREEALGGRHHGGSGRSPPGHNGPGDGGSGG